MLNMSEQNISKAMFQIDEQLSSHSPSYSNLQMNLVNSKSVSAWNVLPSSQGFQDQMPAYLNQVRLSNYYQDNPWPTLENSNKYGVSTMGGQLNLNVSPGKRPGNALKVQPTASNVMHDVQQQQQFSPITRNGIVVPSFMGNSL